MADITWRPFVWGGLGSIIAEFATFPIDLTKTRLQVQGQKKDVKHTKLKYSGMIDVFLQMYQQEGVRALYTGIWPAVLRQATYGTIRLGTYYSLKDVIMHRYQMQETIRVNVFCAAIAGSLAASIANPTDVLKVRLQVGGVKSNRGLVTCFKDIYFKEGLPGLWRGVGPTAQRAAVTAAVELPVYDFFKRYFMNILGNTVANHLSSSTIAGVACAVAITPIDVVRTRLMNQRNLKVRTSTSHAHVYTGSIDCIVKTFKYEGPTAFYKGFIPTCARLGSWNIVFFVSFEQLKKIA